MVGVATGAGLSLCGGVVSTAARTVSAVSEAEWQRGIVELARMLGCRVAHFRPAKTSHGWRTAVAADGAGWPDLTLAKPGRLIFAGLKSATGKLSDDQRAWLAVLAAAGAEVHVWRAGATDMQDIAATLQTQVGGRSSSAGAA